VKHSGRHGLSVTDWAGTLAVERAERVDRQADGELQIRERSSLRLFHRQNALHLMSNYTQRLRGMQTETGRGGHPADDRWQANPFDLRPMQAII
jgi:hypothetical protein